MKPGHQIQHPPIRVEAHRGEIVESVHRVSVATVSPCGALLAAFGDPDQITTLRSAAKPLQAVPLLTLANSGEVSLSDEELAICCASHPGEPRHSALAASVLALSGFLPDDLVCGVGNWPESPLKHGCSGNHAAILLAARLMGAPLDGYHLVEHPVQALILKTIGEMSAAREVLAATDGCGIPTFGLRLSEMAQSFASLVQPDAVWRRIPHAMASNPTLIGSEGWIDVRLMLATSGRIVAKTGAEGLLCAGCRDTGIGVAVKVEDGSTRPLAPAAISALIQIGLVSENEASSPYLAELRRPRTLGIDGEPVGEVIVAASPLEK